MNPSEWIPSQGQWAAVWEGSGKLERIPEWIPSQGHRAAVWEGSGKLQRILQSGYLLKDIGQLSGKDQGSWSESFRADTFSRTSGSCLGRIREAGANPSERIPSQGQRAAVWEGSGKLERILQSGYLLKDIGQLSGKDQGSWSESFRVDTFSRTSGSCLGRIREAGANPSERIPSQGHRAAVWEGSGKLKRILQSGYLLKDIAVWEGSGKLERILQSGYHLMDNGQLSGKDQGSWRKSFRADTFSRTSGSCLGRIREAGANPSEWIPPQGQRAAVWEGSGKLERILQIGYLLKDIAVWEGSGKLE